MVDGLPPTGCISPISEHMMFLGWRHHLILFPDGNVNESWMTISANFRAPQRHYPSHFHCAPKNLHSPSCLNNKTHTFKKFRVSWDLNVLQGSILLHLKTNYFSASCCGRLMKKKKKEIRSQNDTVLGAH